MKSFFILFLLFCGLYGQASDTLTRAQVYNFNVGDTFDYENKINDTYGYYSSADYVRIVIIGTYFSQDSDSLIIHRQRRCFGSGCTNTQLIDDTLIIDSLHTYQVFYDIDTMSNPHLTITDSSQYHGRTTNLIYWPTNYPIRTFGSGLGLVNSNMAVSGLGPACCIFDTALIYYSKGAEKWGTPYYIVEGITNVSAQHASINLYPTVNNGQFKIKIENGSSTSYQLAIYDLTGRQVNRTALNNNINDIELPSVSQGMYLWNVTSQGTILQSGKMIVN